MTDFDAPRPSEQPAATNAAGGSTTGAKTLFWGALLMVVAIVLVIAGSSSPDDGGADGLQSAVQLGWVLGALAVPFILIGCIAVGVRMGLQDRDRD